ncbi:hypothetical protein J0895_10570 [Phormidium pseudopriestleyi FRX01]|uniref:Uncharacterized protein n=1 Tax=Phormidium pseudopriestleyi FRX01 TaxID=1759528 RepID=A0ABS3FR00_9CYAN|nr:hypothetical protein [Phormidium pseudopriestleyi]MBO0349545.1 hypothetical protein [Phormidium pseudopriestleyi FRX01]
MIIGAPQANDDDDTEAVGETYLVYGGPNFDETLDLQDLDGTNGVIMFCLEDPVLGRHSISTTSMAAMGLLCMELQQTIALGDRSVREMSMATGSRIS